MEKALELFGLFLIVYIHNLFRIVKAKLMVFSRLALQLMSV